MKKRVIYIIAAAALIGAFHLLSSVKPLMTAIADFTLSLRRAFARACSLLPFSVAEALLLAASAVLLIYIILSAAAVVRSPGRRLRTLLRRFSLLVCAAETIYLLLCLFLGASYYADNFQDKSGVMAAPSSVDTLYELTDYFAEKLGACYENVPRDEAGRFNAGLDDIFSSARGIYSGAGELFDFLYTDNPPPKRVMLSRLMSRFNYTGYYFPFTGEANINTDAPASLIPSTIAHETAHQQGIASEQEANFAAVLACTLSGDPVYEYSGWLFGYIHLGNALYKYDKEGYYSIAVSLPDEVKADLKANNEYWSAFETKGAEISEKIYDTLLKSYGQQLGVHSYGAVVDLLIAWYIPRI